MYDGHVIRIKEIISHLGGLLRQIGRAYSSKKEVELIKCIKLKDEEKYGRGPVYDEKIVYAHARNVAKPTMISPSYKSNFAYRTTTATNSCHSCRLLYRGTCMCVSFAGVLRAYKYEE